MRIFIAGKDIYPWEIVKFYDFYRLDSYIDICKKRNFDPHKYKDFILDSGVFSFLNGKNTENIDWEEYVSAYGNFVKKHNIQNYVEVDVDRFIGLDGVEKLRVQLEKIVGWQCLPVWHMNRSYDKWLEICRDYKYVCFGAFLTDNLDKSKFTYINKFLYDAKRYDCKVHGLGFTYFKFLEKLKFYSVDSSSWNAPLRFGGFYFQFTGKKLEKTRLGSQYRISNRREFAIHQFMEWVKYGKYAEKNL